MKITQKTIEDFLQINPEGIKSYINGTVQYKQDNRYFDFCIDTPSSSMDGYWVACSYSKPLNKRPIFDKKDNGKWLIFVDKDKVDSVWANIIKLMYEDKLGDYSKCSTAKPNKLQYKIDTHVICIYCYLPEAMTIRQNLKEAGFVDKIPFKLDIAALEGKYTVNGDKNIATLFV
jgi:hypothetical protein